jgi:hypothetical protein
LAEKWHDLPPLSGHFHQGKVEVLAISADSLPSVAAAFRDLPGSPEGNHASNLAGMQA